MDVSGKEGDVTPTSNNKNTSEVVSCSWMRFTRVQLDPEKRKHADNTHVAFGFVADLSAAAKGFQKPTQQTCLLGKREQKSVKSTNYFKESHAG